MSGPSSGGVIPGLLRRLSFSSVGGIWQTSAHGTLQRFLSGVVHFPDFPTMRCRSKIADSPSAASAACGTPARTARERSAAHSASQPRLAAPPSPALQFMTLHPRLINTLHEGVPVKLVSEGRQQTASMLRHCKAQRPSRHLRHLLRKDAGHAIRQRLRPRPVPRPLQHLRSIPIRAWLL